MFRYFNTELAIVLLAASLCGCGSTKSRSATEQLLVSDAVDRSVASIDFSDLSGRSVYLDTQYVKAVKGTGFVNSDYIISSLRQQMLAYRLQLVENRDEAEFIAEVRVGALGSDAHNMTFGIPPSSSLSSAASLVPNAPPIPAIPEISLAKREDEVAAAKIVVFAYDRETRKAYWQSGIAQARSSAKDVWLFGAGPFQKGTIHDGTKLAGDDLEIPLLTSHDDRDDAERLKDYLEPRSFDPPPMIARDPPVEGLKVEPASHQEEAPAEAETKPRDGSAAQGKDAAASSPAE